MANDLERSLRNSVIDGVYAQSMSTITSGLFLTGFVIAMGGTSTHIGAASAIPLVTNVFQLFASYLIERTGARKRICIAACTVSRGLWLAFAALPLARMWGFFSGDRLIWAAISFYFLVSTASAFAGISWLSWMKQLVPAERRGKYFGMRSAVTSAAGLVAGLVFGRFLDAMKAGGENYYLAGFFTLFTTAFALGMASNYYLKKIDEPPPKELAPGAPPVTVGGFLAMLALPFRNRAFARIMGVNILWMLFCHIGSPFMNLFMLKNLGISFTMMAVYEMVNLVANISMYSVWGRLSDHFGNRPILIVTTMFGAVLPLIMVFTTKQNAWLLVPLFQFSTGLVWSGINLTTSNIFLKLAPGDRSSVYLSVNSAANGLITALGPAIGGWLAYSFKDVSLVLDLGYAWLPKCSGYRFSFTIADLQFVFLISVALRLFGAYLFRFVAEPESRPFGNLARVIMHGRDFAATFVFTPIYESVSQGIERIEEIPARVAEGVRNIGESLIHGNRPAHDKAAPEGSSGTGSEGAGQPPAAHPASLPPAADGAPSTSPTPGPPAVAPVPELPAPAAGSVPASPEKTNSADIIIPGGEKEPPAGEKNPNER